MLLLRKNNFIILLIVAVSSACTNWQKYDTNQFGATKKLHFTDYSIQFKVAPKDKKIKTKNDVYYFWFGGDRIISTQGAYSENLLHGIFTAVYSNKNLKEKGEYVYGRKDGTWREWDIDGELLEVSNWKNGLKHGKLLTYKKGELINEVLYKKNELIVKKQPKEKVKKTSKKDESIKKEEIKK